LKDSGSERNKHTEVTMRYNKNNMPKEVKNLTSAINEDLKTARFEERIDELNEEVLLLREKVFKYRDEIHTMRNSRVLGRIIKVQETIGDPKTLPRRVVFKARRTVAKLIPDVIRLSMMRVLRGGRNRVRAKLNDHRMRSVVTTIVSNEPWPIGTPLVSVVVPYYNRADTIDDTLESLRNQTFQNFETIIVDDVSTDPKSINKLKTVEVARVIHHETNKGVAEARNTGIKEAKGKYIICLDSDDMLESTFIEKATLTLELNPDVALVGTYQDAFGVVRELFEKHPYDPLRLIWDNMVITAAQFRREAWETSGGYKSDLGYEDWDFWLTLSEHGYWGRVIPEPLFKYRTAMSSRYVEDKDLHWNNIKKIQDLHPNYRSTVKKLLAKNRVKKHVIDRNSAFINLLDESKYLLPENNLPNILITVPWLDFGGASTLLYNFMREVDNDINLHIATGLPSKNEWDYKFRELTPLIFHMPSMFDTNPDLQLEFLSHYIKIRKIDILHIVHNGFIYDMLPELRYRHPQLKIVSTVFNDRAPYLEQSIKQQDYIDVFTTDNNAVGEIYTRKISGNHPAKVIPNGVDTDKTFNPKLYDRKDVSKEIKLNDDELAVFYIGRLSEEKNPDVFVEAAKTYQKQTPKTKVRFYIIGDGPMQKEIVEKIHKEGISNVIYLGYQKDVARYLSAADVFILPSAVEGFPLSILEAMAMKVAVIASNVGAVSDVIEGGVNGYIVKPGSVDEICEALSLLLDDKNRIAIQKRAREDAEKLYSSDQLGVHYRRLYKETLS
jgi:glycosyltransferase involved in cell wall biosynthesis